MLEEMKNVMNKTYTENGAVTELTTDSDCLDLFATIGALRRADDKEITERFMRAYAEDPDLAMKILFYCRDIRGGIGERRVFRTIIRFLGDKEPGSVKKNIGYFSEFGRYDDLLVLIGTKCQDEAVKMLKDQFEKDMEALKNGDDISLLGKWMPSANASSKETVRLAKILIKEFGMREEEYRKALTALRKRIDIIEERLRVKDYTFDYSKQTSRSMFKYRQAFVRNDGERYSLYMDSVNRGEEKINTSALMPYEIIRPYFESYRINDVGDKEEMTLDTMWNNLTDYTDGRNAIAVVDGSGSMYAYCDPVPETVAMSLGIYFAERNKGHFKDHFITFSENPRLVRIKGNTIGEKVRYCSTFNEVSNTNIERVFQLILKAAVDNDLPQEELPETIYIISDMEFDHCTRDAGLTNFENAKKMFEKNGYTLPKVVFWNVASRNRQQPVQMNEAGVALVSGSDPKLFSLVMENDLDPKEYTPYKIMMSILGKERYSCITA